MSYLFVPISESPNNVREIWTNEIKDMGIDPISIGVMKGNSNMKCIKNNYSANWTGYYGVVFDKKHYEKVMNLYRYFCPIFPNDEVLEALGKSIKTYIPAKRAINVTK